MPTFTQDCAPLFTALAKAQAEFTAVTRDRVNPQFKSRYATLDGIREMALPILAANGLSVIQWPSTVRIDGVLHVCAHFLLAHSSGATFQPDDLVIPLADNKANSTAQQIGVAATYGARYQFRDVLGICGTDDTDTDAPREPAPRAHVPPPAPAPVVLPSRDLPESEQVSGLVALFAAAAGDRARINAVAAAVSAAAYPEGSAQRSAARDAMKAAAGVRS